MDELRSIGIVNAAIACRWIVCSSNVQGIRAVVLSDAWLPYVDGMRFCASNPESVCLLGSLEVRVATTHLFV